MGAGRIAYMQRRGAQIGSTLRKGCIQSHLNRGKLTPVTDTDSEMMYSLSVSWYLPLTSGIYTYEAGDSNVLLYFRVRIQMSMYVTFIYRN